MSFPAVVLASRTMYPRASRPTTSRVARSSSSATCSAFTLRRRGCGALGVVDSSALATRAPRSVEVASMMTMFDSCCDDFVFAANAIGSTVIRPRKTGPSRVVMRNHRDRTRSRNSRLNTTRTLSMAGHPLFDAGRAHSIEKDLVQRRRYHLEATYTRSGGDNLLEQVLRIRARCELDLEKAVLVVGARDEPAILQHREQPVPRRPVHGKRNVARSFGLLHRGHLAVQYLLPASDDAYGVAQALGIVHEVRAEDHRL